MVYEEGIISPITGEKDVFLVREIGKAYLVERWENELGIDITRELCSVNKVSLFCCRNTFLKFYLPHSVAGSDSMYEQLSKHDWYYMPDKWEFRCATKDVRGLDRIAEVGCANGDFLAKLKENGMDVVGFEFNKKAAKEARKKGISVHSENIYEVDNQLLGSFDAVCSFQVLEHVVDPKQFINDSLRLLKPGGKLILSVPNGYIAENKLTNAILDMPPHHMTQWYPETFKRLEGYFSMKIIRMAKEPLASYHVNWYLECLERKIPCKFRLRSYYKKYIEDILRRFLLNGGRKLLTGHTLYVCYVKK